MELELVVGMMLRLMVFAWDVEMFALFEEWPDLFQQGKRREWLLNA